MPRQHVVCGRPVPRLGSRHVSLLLVGLALFAVLSLLFTLPAAGPAAGRRFSVPKSLKSPWVNRLNPFRQPSHPPAAQKHDTDGDSWWYADWNWLLMPFSSSVTLDESRALLPVLRDRTPVYCFYDAAADRDRASRDAESELLLAWRRAWWAQGFRPIILGPAEAMNNPLYEELQRVPDISPALKTDLTRWLAWENMGDGVLARHLLFPMGPHEDPLLTFLRRGEFPKLTRFSGLDDGLFVGSKADVAAAIKLALASPKAKEAEDVVAAVEAASGKEKEDPFALDDAPKSLAYYSARHVQDLYPKIADAVTESHAAGLRSLTQLVNAHLHVTWQNVFADGIAVVKPLPQHSTYLITPAYELASRLAHCPESPLPDSCPPNRRGCRPCDDSKPMKITTPPHYSDAGTVYTIGTVPHPYTSSTLMSLRSELSIPWIRRESPRDPWITALTAPLFSDAMSTTPRLLLFKEAVASTPDDSPSISSSSSSSASSSSAARQGKDNKPRGGAARSLWLPAEQAIPDDLDWHFGFALPDAATYAVEQAAGGNKDDNKTPPGTASPFLPPLHGPEDGPRPSPDELALEPDLLARAQAVVLSGSKSPPAKIRLPPTGNTKSQPDASPKKPSPPAPSKSDLALRDAVEAWNLADTEAWRFARAYLARKSVERRRWEDQEARYAGGMGSERKSSAAASAKNTKGGKGVGKEEEQKEGKRGGDDDDTTTSPKKEKKEKEKEKKQQPEKEGGRGVDEGAAAAGAGARGKGSGGARGGSAWSRWLDPS